MSSDGVDASPTVDQSLPVDPSLEPLQILAGQLGVDTWFPGEHGERIEVSRSTLLGVLAALGITADTDAAVAAAQAEADLAPWRRLLPPVVVVRQEGESALTVHARQGASVSVWISTEDGQRHDLAQRDEWWDTRLVDGQTVSRRIFGLPGQLPLGWHELHAETAGHAATAPLVVTPGRLQTPPALQSRRSWGLMAQLYSVRSRGSWGIGDFADLADLATIAGAQFGAGFVLVNPLNAAEPAPPVQPSPYLPSSRRFFHPLYLRVEQVPEYDDLPQPALIEVDALAERMRRANTDADGLDRDPIYAAKLQALQLIHRVPRSAAREAQYTDFRAREGEALQDFALWCALAEHGAVDATVWSGGPQGDIARQQAAALADRVEFHSWLQWLCDEQLAAAQCAARAAGMPLGIMHDLPVGVQPHGADAWLLRDVLAAGVTVGAPPDMFNQQGQNWSQPPWHPARLQETGYAAYRDMLRSVLRHAGGLRVDHVLGLFRLWWIPNGGTAREGTYVHYDHEALIGILALEAQRAGAVVIGEDLGVFEPWVRDYLDERGIFGTSIVWFERDGDRPLPPERYRQHCLTSVNTHDLPPAAGYLAGDHVTLRDRLGLLQHPLTEERTLDAAEQGAVLGLLRERGLVTDAAPSVADTVTALYALTTLTPSTLLGVALVDAVGERRTQNQPGTVDEYPNWRVPLAGPDGAPVFLEDLPTNARCAALIRAVSGRE